MQYAERTNDDRRQWKQPDGTIALVGVFTPAELRAMADELEAAAYAAWAEQAAREAKEVDTAHTIEME